MKFKFINRFLGKHPLLGVASRYVVLKTKLSFVKSKIDIAGCKSGDLLLTMTQAEPMRAGDASKGLFVEWYNSSIFI